MSQEPLWRRYLRFRGPDVEADIDDEVSFHLEMRERDFLAAGMSPEEAREAARSRFGDVPGVREWLRSHDLGRIRRKERVDILDRLIQDVRYGLRQLRQQPGFTVAAVVVLALGVGATTAMFSAVDAVLLRPLPFAQDERLVEIGEISIPLQLPSRMTPPRSGPEITDLGEMPGVFTSYAAYAPGNLNLTGTGDPLRVRIALVTPSFFPTLGVNPARGRPFTAEEGIPGGPQVAILSDALWRRQFGRDIGAIGDVIALNGKEYRIVGVMPRGFAFPSDTEVWLPMPVPITFAHWEPFRQHMPASIIGRLAPGVTVESAGERIRSLLLSYESASQLTERTAAELVRPLRETLVGERRAALLVLMGATALVLLIAAANIANLLLSRSSARRHEIAMRSALGATPGRITQQLLVESLLLAVIGGTLGVVLAFASIGVLETLIPSSMIGAAPVRIDGRVLLFTLGTVLVTGFAFGLWPALGARRTDAGEVVRSGGAGRATAGDQPRLRRIFIVGELALALMLLVAAGIMLRSFGALLATDAGVDPERVATLELTLARASHSKAPARRQFMEAVLERLRTAPGLEAYAFVNELPLRGIGGVLVNVEADGSVPAEGQDRTFAQDLRITPDYFRALGIPMLKGRSLSERVDSLSPEVVVNEALADLLWPGEEAVGQLVRIPGNKQPHEVVGVVANVRPKALDSDVVPQMYNSLLATPYPHLALVARGRGSAEVLASQLREAVLSAAPEQAIYNVRTMEQVISEAVAPRRTHTQLITAFGALALLLAAVGVYGVIAHGVSRRTREFGIRIALGARPRDVMLQVTREGVTLAAIGIVLGLFGAWGLTRFLASMVYGVSPQDPVSFVAAPLVLLAIATLATLLPARRATRVDPAIALRAD